MNNAAMNISIQLRVCFKITQNHSGGGAAWREDKGTSKANSHLTKQVKLREQVLLRILVEMGLDI